MHSGPVYRAHEALSCLQVALHCLGFLLFLFELLLLVASQDRLGLFVEFYLVLDFGGSGLSGGLLDELLVPGNPLFGVFLWGLGKGLGLQPLGIVEGVGEEQVVLAVDLVPAGRKLGLGHHALLEFLHLREVVVSDFESFLLAVDVLQTLVEAPVVLLHEVAHQHRAGPRLAVHRVDQAALPRLHGFLHELENGVDCVVLLIEDLGEAELRFPPSRSNGRRGTVCRSVRRGWGWFWRRC